MKLTIITINLNNAAGLSKTIESVANQNYSDFEYIIIDGGSTDGSVELIDENDNKISYWVSEPDKGIYNAMNKGILKANGDYLLFLNSGDWILENVLDKVLSIDFSDFDIFYGNAFIVYNNGLKKLYKEKRDLTFFDFYTGTICHQATLIKRILFDKFGLYDEEYKIVSDWLFFIKVIVFGQVSVKYIDMTIVNVDGHGIGSSEYALIERTKALNTILPKMVIDDYEDLINQKNLAEKSLIELNHYKHRFYWLDKLFTFFKLNKYKKFFSLKYERKNDYAPYIFEKVSFSQSGEDLIIQYILHSRDCFSFTYIDIGAYHPFNLNNTYLFYKNGNYGINIEPNPDLFRLFIEGRGNDINLNIGISNEDNQLEYYFIDTPSLNTFCQEEKDRILSLGHKLLKSQFLPVKKINDVIEQYMNKNPDIILVDVEGFDYQIISDLDFSRFAPKIICIESISYNNDGKGLKNNQLIDYIQNKGYLLYADTNINSIFVQQDFWFR
jgi:FkbM family methyltransferase